MQAAYRRQHRLGASGSGPRVGGIGCNRTDRDRGCDPRVVDIQPASEIHVFVIPGWLISSQHPKYMYCTPPLETMLCTTFLSSVCWSSVVGSRTRASAKQGIATTFPPPSTPKTGIFPLVGLTPEFDTLPYVPDP